MRKILTVEDTFTIKGRGIVVTGWQEKDFPIPQLNNLIEIICPDGKRINSQIIGIEKFRICFGEGQAGKNYGFLLKDISKKEDIPRGSEIFLIDN